MTLLTIIAAARPTALAVSEPRSSRQRRGDLGAVPDDPLDEQRDAPRELDGPSVMTALTVAKPPALQCRPVQGRFQSHGAAETEALGGRLAAELGAGDVVLVEGELGAGKTTFVRGAAGPWA